MVGQRLVAAGLEDVHRAVRGQRGGYFGCAHAHVRLVVVGGDPPAAVCVVDPGILSLEDAVSVNVCDC